MCVSTAPSACALGLVKYTELNFTAGYALYNCACDKYKKKNIYIYIYILVFFQNRYPIMVKCLNIGKNIGTPIYRSISSIYTAVQNCEVNFFVCF